MPCFKISKLIYLFLITYLSYLSALLYIITKNKNKKMIFHAQRANIQREKPQAKPNLDKF